jgi:hypothetical protein
VRVFLVAALVCAIFALICATGTALVTTWPVWLCAALVAYFADLLVGGVSFPRPPG